MNNTWINSSSTQIQKTLRWKEISTDNLLKHKLQDIYWATRQAYKGPADRNKIWDKSQLGTCSGVLGTVDQLLIDSGIMDEVREKKRNLADGSMTTK